MPSGLTTGQSKIHGLETFPMIPSIVSATRENVPRLASLVVELRLGVFAVDSHCTQCKFNVTRRRIEKLIAFINIAKRHQ